MKYYLVTIKDSAFPGEPQKYMTYLADMPSLAAYLLSRPNAALINSLELSPGQMYHMRKAGYKTVPSWDTPAWNDKPV